MDINDLRARQIETERRSASVLALTGHASGSAAMMESVSSLASSPIAKVWREAIDSYKERTGKLPGADLLASAHAAVERLLTPNYCKRHAPRNIAAMFESGDLSTANSAGIDRLQHWAALYLPALLAQQTADLATWVNCGENFQHYQIAAFDHVAAADFGAFKAGESLTNSSPRLLATLGRIVSFDDQPDATKKTFNYATADGLPIKPGTVRVYANHEAVSGFDNPFAPSGSDKINLTGDFSGATLTIKHAAGTVKLVTKTAPAADVTLELEFAVDDEALDPAKMPGVVMKMKTRDCALKPQMLTCEYSIQALFDAQRETGLDLWATSTQALINIMATEQDNARIRRLAFLTKSTGTITLDAKNMDGMKFAGSLKRALQGESNALAALNGSVGANYAVAGEKAASWLMSHPEFVTLNDYTPGPGIRVAGVLFGTMTIYIVSADFIKDFASAGTLFPFGTNDVILVGNDDNGGSPLVTGDPIPPLPGMPIDHGVSPLLTRRATVLSQTLCDSNIDGALYARRVTLTVTE